MSFRGRSLPRNLLGQAAEQSRLAIAFRTHDNAAIATHVLVLQGSLAIFFMAAVEIGTGLCLAILRIDWPSLAGRWDCGDRASHRLGQPVGRRRQYEARPRRNLRVGEPARLGGTRDTEGVEYATLQLHAVDPRAAADEQSRRHATGKHGSPDEA